MEVPPPLLHLPNESYTYPLLCMVPNRQVSGGRNAEHGCTVPYSIRRRFSGYLSSISHFYDGILAALTTSLVHEVRVTRVCHGSGPTNNTVIEGGWSRS